MEEPIKMPTKKERHNHKNIFDFVMIKILLNRQGAWAYHSRGPHNFLLKICLDSRRHAPYDPVSGMPKRF